MMFIGLQTHLQGSSPWKEFRNNAVKQNLWPDNVCFQSKLLLKGSLCSNFDVSVAHTTAQSKLLQLLWVTSAVNIREPAL